MAASRAERIFLRLLSLASREAEGERLKSQLDLINIARPSLGPLLKQANKAVQGPAGLWQTGLFNCRHLVAIISDDHQWPTGAGEGTDGLISAGS